MCVANFRRRPSKRSRNWSAGEALSDEQTLTAISQCSGCPIAVEFLNYSENFPGGFSIYSRSMSASLIDLYPHTKYHQDRTNKCGRRDGHRVRFYKVISLRR